MLHVVLSKVLHLRNYYTIITSTGKKGIVLLSLKYACVPSEYNLLTLVCDNVIAMTLEPLFQVETSPKQIAYPQTKQDDITERTKLNTSFGLSDQGINTCISHK